MIFRKLSWKRNRISQKYMIWHGNRHGNMFMNQIIEQGFQIHIVNQFLRDLAPDFDDEIEFTAEGGYTAYNDLIMDVFEYVTKNYEYAIKKAKNNKGYDVYYVDSVFDKE